MISPSVKLIDELDSVRHIIQSEVIKAKKNKQILQVRRTHILAIIIFMWMID